MEKAKILEKLRKIMGISNIALTSSGDNAIEAAMLIAKSFNYEKILIPDQGGWFSYRKLPTKINLEYEELKTDLGVIMPEELKKYRDCAFIFTSFAGYFAEQPLGKICSICRKNKILLIEDITGSIGWQRSKADILVSSFSEWKPINLGYGGVVGVKDKKHFERAEIQDFLNRNTFGKDELYERLMEKINNLKRRYKFFFNLQKKVKRELRDFELIHRRYRGLNVVAKYSTDEEMEKLINYCKKNNYEFVKCPNYIKVNEKAVSIELKRLSESEVKK